MRATTTRGRGATAAKDDAPDGSVGDDGQDNTAATTPAGAAATTTRVAARVTRSALLIVFIHGFKGSAQTTFADFPSRLSHLVAETLAPRGYEVRCTVYPTYETRGSLQAAVDAFLEWLVLEVATIEGGAPSGAAGEDESKGARQHVARGQAKVILCGHSMGGLVAVDAALSLLRSRPSADAPLWPRLLGLLAFDTPYYGIHPGVFRNTLTRYGGYLQQGHQLYTRYAPLASGAASVLGGLFGRGGGRAAVGGAGGGGGGGAAAASSSSSRSWTRSIIAGSALAAVTGGAAATAWAGGGFDYLGDHFLFVKNLWDDKGLKTRLEELTTKPQIFFHAFYNRLPALGASTDGNSGGHGGGGGGSRAQSRTFCILPALESEAWRCFEAVDDATASDEIEAHTRMFYTSNPAYFALGLRTAHLITRCVEAEDTEGDQRGARREADERSRRDDERDEREHVSVLHDDGRGGADEGA